MYSNNFNFRSREKYSIEYEGEREKEREELVEGAFDSIIPPLFIFSPISRGRKKVGESGPRTSEDVIEEDDNGRDVTWYGAKSFRVSSCVHLRPPIMLIVLIVSLTRLLAVVYAQ